MHGISRELNLIILISAYLSLQFAISAIPTNLTDDMSLPMSDDAVVQVVSDAYSVNARTGADPLCSFPRLVCGKLCQHNLILLCTKK